ncbi:MAG: hypothetical protein JXR07_13465 [Reichenbachiella sp.]
MKKIILIATMVLGGITSHAQEKDPVKMNRDLKIAEDIVSSLFKGQSKGGYFYSVRPKATYVPDFGVMISINGNSRMYSKSIGSSFSFSWDDDESPVVIDMDDLHDIEFQAQQLAVEAEELAKMYEREGEMNEAKEREIERQAEKMEEQAMEMKIQARKMEKTEMHHGRTEEGREVVVIRSDEDQAKMQEEIKEIYKEVITTFFTDYADLIGQLEDKEKIMLSANVGSSGNGATFKSAGGNKISATVARKNIKSFKSGKTSEAKFIESIMFVEDAGTKKSPDLELLSSIFERLYKSDIATTYYCHENIPYQRLENFGVIYKMKVYSSTSYGKDLHKITTLHKSGLSQEERDEIVNGMYPQFESELKENILDYAKTVKSLKEDENLIFQVNLTQCDGCEMPKQIDVTVSQSTLIGYDSGKLKREDALKRISVKEGR